METAVDFAVEQLSKEHPIYTKNDIIKKAKEIERDQIIDAYQQGFNNAYFSNPLSKEQYYNENFKNK